MAQKPSKRPRRVKSDTWPPIRERSATSAKGKRYKYFVVDLGVVDGKRTRKNFRDLEAAERWAETKRLERRKIGQDAARLTDRQKSDAVRAYEALPENMPLPEVATKAAELGSIAAIKDAVEATRKLAGRGHLIDAVAFYLDHHDPDGGDKTVDEVIREYILSRKKARRRPRTIRDIEGRLGMQLTKSGTVDSVSGFAKRFFGVPVRQLTTHDLQSWLDAQSGNGTTRNNRRVHLVGLLNFAKRRGWVSANRAEVIERVKLTKKRPHILTPEDTERLMKYVQANDPKLVPYFALCAFCGIRPDGEATRLKWADVDLKKAKVYISGDVSKTGDERYVDIPANAVAWLLLHKKRTGTIYYDEPRAKRVRRKCGVQWKADCLRHSYGSYHLALHENAGKTALQMGHRELGTLFDHYRQAVEDKDIAKRYFEIRPEADNVIQMESKTA